MIRKAGTGWQSSYHVVERCVLEVLTAAYEAALEIYWGLCLDKPSRGMSELLSPQRIWGVVPKTKIRRMV